MLFLKLEKIGIKNVFLQDFMIHLKAKRVLITSHMLGLYMRRNMRVTRLGQVENFQIYNTEGFLFYANQQLGTQVDSDSIDDVWEVYDEKSIQSREEKTWLLMKFINYYIQRGWNPIKMEWFPISLMLMARAICAQVQIMTLSSAALNTVATSTLLVISWIHLPKVIDYVSFNHLFYLDYTVRAEDRYVDRLIKRIVINSQDVMNNSTKKWINQTYANVWPC